MANIISVLAADVANKIAAGEVVEGPASVVKELIENAIDAGSTSIEVFIENGGIDLIRVKDNGKGMSPADALLSLERHATSKLHRAEDLNHIHTLGFRGEALPSVASVSKLEMVTRGAKSIEGIKLYTEGGKVLLQEPTGCPFGTTITVRQLFYNTPARLKYLKSVAVEFGKISDFINRLALSYSSIAFSLYHNQRKITQTPGNGNLLESIASIYGKDLAKNMLPVSCEDGEKKISGFIAKPIHTRSSRYYQSFFVNERYIRSRLMSNAVQEAFHTLLPLHRYPFCVLFLSCALENVDVNVHPAKMEVRFRDEKIIYQLVLTGVKKALSEAHLIPEISSEHWKENKKFNMKPVQSDFNFDVNDSKQQKKYEEPYLNQVNNNHDDSFVEPTYKHITEAIEKVMVNLDAVKEIPATISEPSPSASKNIDQYHTIQSDLIEDEKLNSNTRISDDNQSTADKNWQLLKPIGQIDQTYIVCQEGKNMLLIDQHAAHERVLYEKFLEAASLKQIPSQILLIPETIELTPQEYEMVTIHISFLKNLGFDIESFGQNTFIIRAVPAFLEPIEIHDFILSILDQLMALGKGNTMTQCLESTIVMMACKAAIKAGKKLELADMEKLIEQLAHTKMPYTCPHGRPTIIKFTIYELEKMFKRV